MNDNNRLDDSDDLSEKSEGELYQMVYEMHQLSDAYWGGRAEAEIRKRGREHAKELIEKQKKVAQFSAFAAIASAIIAFGFLIFEIIKFLSD